MKTSGNGNATLLLQAHCIVIHWAHDERVGVASVNHSRGPLYGGVAFAFARTDRAHTCQPSCQRETDRPEHLARFHHR